MFLIVLIIGSALMSSVYADVSCDGEKPAVGVEKPAKDFCDLVDLSVDKTVKTSKGAVFTHVDKNRFGDGMRAPDGTIWGKFIGKKTNEITQLPGGKIIDSDAEKACADTGGTLPNKKEFERLKSYFDLDENGYLTDKGRADLAKVFPDMKGRPFWTSSPDPADSKFAVYFDGDFGVIDVSLRKNEESVRCVSH